MPKGNKLAYLNSPIADNTPIDYDENRNMIEHCLEIFDRPIPDLSKPEEVKQAIDNYFRSCISRGLRPGNMGLYACFNLSARQVKELFEGKIKLNANYQSIEYLKKACKTMSSIRESLGSQGKLNPATLIFWQKNFDGLSDVQQVEIAAVQQAVKSPEQIAAEIEDDIPET